jgi:hypothetical protein
MDQNLLLINQIIVPYSSRIDLELPPREGVAALPYAEIPNPLGEYFAEAAVRADAAVRPYAEDLDRVASFEIHPGTKKRHMRCIVVSRLPVGFSTADVFRLPNWAGFCIRGGIVKYGRHGK